MAEIKWDGIPIPSRLHEIAGIGISFYIAASLDFKSGASAKNAN